MDILNLERSPISVDYFDPKFQKMLEEHLVLLRNSAKKRPANIDSQKSYMFIGDFYGYLSSINVPVNQHYINLRLNGFEHPSDYTSELKILYLADPDKVDLLFDIYKTRVNR